MRNPTHIVLSDGTVRNIYDVRLRNMANEEREFVLSITENPDLRLSLEGEAATSVTLAPDEMAQVRVYLEAPNGTPSALLRRAARCDFGPLLPERKTGFIQKLCLTGEVNDQG